MNLDIMKMGFLSELEKIAEEKTATELTEEARSHIKSKNFALSAKQSDTGKPAYPIEDRRHAANALSRVGQFGSPKEKAEVYKDVAHKYPDMAHHSDVPAVRKAAGINPEHMKKFVEGAKGELGPALGATLGAGLGNIVGINPLAGAAAGYGLGALPEIAHAVHRRGALQRAA